MLNRRIGLFLTVSSLCLLVMSCRVDSPRLDLELVKAYQPELDHLKSSLISLHFIIETSPVDKVDTVFNQIIKSYELPVSAKGLPDGIYTGSSPYDAFDYRHAVEIEVKDEKIIAIDYNELPYEGSGKQEDEEYCKEMSVTGTTPAIAYPSMESQMIDKQDMMEVDAVSGATYSLYRFRYALTVALMKGALGIES